MTDEKYTVEKRWQDYRRLVYPTLPENSEQIKQLKLAWFSSYLDCMTVVQAITIRSKTVDESVDALNSLQNEADGFCMKSIEQLLKDMPTMSPTIQ